MNTQEPAAERFGWFGKIPSLGDFARRGLPLSFVEPWDHWLSTELSASRQLLGAAWGPTYRQMPVLCFSLGAGVVDDGAWQGILVPSFDRVGREFPLTIARRQRPESAAALDGRLQLALVATGRRSLNPACGADELDRALADLVEIERASPSTIDAGERTSVWWRGDPEDSPRAIPTRFDGLPRGPRFRALLAAASGWMG